MIILGDLFLNLVRIKIYIDSSKPYYYPGEQILASILLDVLEEVNCNKMLIVVKGKQIIKASQLKMIQTENIDNDEEEEEFENDNEDNIKRDSEDSSYNYKNEKIEFEDAGKKDNHITNEANPFHSETGS